MDYEFPELEEYYLYTPKNVYPTIYSFFNGR